MLDRLLEHEDRLARHVAAGPGRRRCSRRSRRCRRWRTRSARSRASCRSCRRRSVRAAFSGGLTSAVAPTNFTSVDLARPSSGAASTSNSVSAHGPVDRAARPAARQVRVVQQFQPDGRDLRQRRSSTVELGRVLRRRVALRRGSSRRPARSASARRCRRARGRTIVHSGWSFANRRFPRGHPLGPVGRARACRLVFDLARSAGRIAARCICCSSACRRRRCASCAVVEEGEQPVVVVVRDRIVLVRVALGALDRQAEHALADGVHAVEHRLHAELLGVDAAFFVDHRVAQEAGGDALVLRRVRAAGRRRSAR